MEDQNDTEKEYKRHWEIVRLVGSEEKRWFSIEIENIVVGG